MCAGLFQHDVKRDGNTRCLGQVGVHQVMKKGGPQEDHAGCRLNAMLWIDLRVVSDRRHVGLGPGVKKRDCSRGTVTAPWQRFDLVRYSDIVRAR